MATNFTSNYGLLDFIPLGFLLLNEFSVLDQVIIYERIEYALEHFFKTQILSAQTQQYTLISIANTLSLLLDCTLHRAFSVAKPGKELHRMHHLFLLVRNVLRRLMHHNNDTAHLFLSRVLLPPSFMAMFLRYMRDEKMKFVDISENITKG